MFRVSAHVALALFTGMCAALVFRPDAAASDRQSGTGGGAFAIAAVMLDDASEIAVLHPRVVREAARLGVPVAVATEDLIAASAHLFQYPVRMSKTSAGVNGDFVSNHVDHDPGAGLEDFACGTRTYNGHNGLDLVLFPYRWDMMDRCEVAVVAAMRGTVIRTRDGEYDRNCATGDVEANYVILRHDNGLLGYYWHLKKGSVAKLSPGDVVAAGQFLGYIGSSGSSTAPHLHFELRDANLKVVDPWTGKCNKVASAWTHQPPTIDTAILRVASHDKQPPAPSSGCDNPDPGYADRFNRGDEMWAAVYLRDQTSADKAQLQIQRPDGSVAASWTTGAPPSGTFPVSYWWGKYSLPGDAPKGRWTVVATLDGTAYAHRFLVGKPLKRTKIAAKITSKKHRSVKPGKTAQFIAQIDNVAKQTAIGCRASAGRPINGTFQFRAIDKKTLKPVQGAGAPLKIGKGKSGHLRLSVKTAKSFKADRAEIAVHFDCTNSKAAAYKAGRTVVRLTSK